jgi:transcriptional regulator of acetoin/glycerol metabolism
MPNGKACLAADERLRLKVACSTRKDSKALIRRGGFPDDLYYQIHVIVTAAAPGLHR